MDTEHFVQRNINKHKPITFLKIHRITKTSGLKTYTNIESITNFFKPHNFS